MHACMCVCARMYACYQFISDCNLNLDRFHRSVCENACVCARCVSGTPFPCVCLSACACATLCACYSGVCACMCLPQCLGMCIFSMRAYVHVSVWVSGLGYLWLHGCGSVCQCVSVVVCVCVCRCVAGVHSMQRLAWCRMVTYKVCLRRKIQHYLQLISFFVLQTMEDSGSLVDEMLDGRMSAEPSDPLAENHSNEMLTEPTDFCQPAQPEGQESQDGHPGGPVAPLLTITLEEGVGICLLCEQTHEDLRLLLACIKQKHMVYFRIGESS